MADKKAKPAKPAKVEKPKREAPAKQKSPKKKGKRPAEPLSREERKKAAWQRKTERKVAKQAITEVETRASAGLTFDQLENPSLAARQSKPAGPTFDQTLLEVVAEQARQFESAESVRLPMDILEPEVRIILGNEEAFNNTTIEDIVEPIGDAATREVVTAEIRSLLERTGATFSAFRDRSDSLLSAIGIAFEKELGNSPLRLRLAEVILADDPVAVEDLLEEIWNRVAELQIIASSLDPESELEKSARLGLIDEAIADRLKKAATEEAIRLDLSQRLAGLTASTGAPAEVDETFATLIAEAAQAAKVQRRERAAFRQTLSQRLRGRKEREGRRFSSERPESDEEFLFFLASHQEERGAKQALLALHLEAKIAAAEKRWADLKSRLAAASANDPETAVAQNVTAMKNTLGDLAQIRALHVQLEELDRLG